MRARIGGTKEYHVLALKWGGGWIEGQARNVCLPDCAREYHVGGKDRNG